MEVEMDTDFYNMIWLDDAKELGLKLILIRQNVQKLFKKTDFNQCLHAKDHCVSVENAFHHLIPKEQYKELSINDRFFLLASPWILNIAWNEPPDVSIGKLTDEWRHSKSIEALDDERTRDFLALSLEEANIFQHMIMYHSFTKDLEQCPKELTLGPDTIRVRLLTAYLRLADAIHVDESGGPTSLFYFLDNPDSPELFHWLKSRLQPSIRPEPAMNTIEVYVNKQINVSDNLIKTLENELVLHVDSTKNTLVRGNITSYLSVKFDLLEGPQISLPKRTELEKLMREFDLSFPPNAGALQGLYLSSVHEVVKKNMGTDMLLQEVAQLQAIAKEAKKLRRCHIGLEHYIKECDGILRSNEEDSKKLRKIVLWVEKSLRERTERLSTVYDKASQELRKFDHFLLFGFSTTIINSFQKMNDTINNGYTARIFICDAHNKSRLDSSKRLMYIDGINYAEQIRAVFPKATINIIPDITVANIINLNTNQRWAMLFGANGVTKEAACGHSAGHLTLAIVAKYFKLPVYIVCDSYKIGDLEPDDNTEREDQWLKCVPELRRAQHHGFSLYNLRENVIHPDFVGKIITEDGVFSVSEFQERYSAEQLG